MESKKAVKINDRQRRFCELLVEGRSAAEAYAAVYTRHKREFARQGAAKVLAKPHVREHVEKLRAELAERTMLEMVASRQEALEFLTAVLRTPAGAVDELSRICQSFKQTRLVKEIRMPSKLEAIEKLSKMLGWDAPVKVEHEGDALLELYEAIRAGSSPSKENGSRQGRSHHHGTR